MAACGTCGSQNWTLRYGKIRCEPMWRLFCENRHEWIPTPGTEITLTELGGRKQP